MGVVDSWIVIAFFFMLFGLCTLLADRLMAWIVRRANEHRMGAALKEWLQ